MRESSTNAAAARLVVPEPERRVPPTNTVVLLPPAVGETSTPSGGAAAAREPLSLLRTSIQEADVLSFTNGDQFVGSFAGFANGLFQWGLPVAKSAIQFRHIGLESLELVGPVLTNPPSPTGWLVMLTDGSLLRARTVKMEADRLEADLSIGGRVTFQRQQLAALRRVEKGRNELVSFDDAPGYGVVAQGDERRVSYKVRYRDVALPEALLLEFAWPANELQNCSLRLFAGQPEELNRAYPQLNLNASRMAATLSLLAPNNNAHLALARALTNSTVRTHWVGFAFSRKSGEAALYLDGKTVGRGTLTLPIKLPDFGLAVNVSQRSYAMPRYLIVSQLGDTLAVPAGADDKDVLSLANSDALLGRLEAVTSNAVVFTSSLGRTELPLERLTQVSFARGVVYAAKPGEAILTLAGGELLRAALQRVDDQTVLAHSAVIGPVSLPRRALYSADLNPDRPVTQLQELWHDQELPFARGGGNLRSWLLARRYAGTYEPGLLRLKARSTYHGELVGIQDGFVQWQHPASLEPLEIDLAQVQRIAPMLRPLPASASGNATTVRLLNGNVLTGRLGAGDPEHLELATAAAGSLSIPRRHVAALSSMPALPETIDKGPTTEWTAPSGGPLSLRHGVVWMDGFDRSCSRRLNLPDRVRLDFEATWSRGRLVISTRLFHSTSTNEERRTENYYGVDLHEGAVTFSARLPALTNAQVHAMVPATKLLTNLNQRCQGVFTVLADRTNNQLRVYLDGHLAGEWRAPAGLVPAGDGIQINANSTAALALRQIFVSEWRELPVPPATPLPPLPEAARGLTEALVVLHNGDRLSLESLRYEANALAGRSKLLGPVTLSAAFVRSIEWPLPPPTPATTR